MSGLEIERKFLVKKGDAYKGAAFLVATSSKATSPLKGPRFASASATRKAT